MITFETACKIAKEEFVKSGYVRMVTPAFISCGCWLFEASSFEDNITEYGSCPLKVNMNSGETEWFSISDPTHWDELDSITETIDVPETYLDVFAS